MWSSNDGMKGKSGEILGPALLRDSFERGRTAVGNRGVDLTTEPEERASLEAERRRLLPEVEGLKREQNAAAEEVARAKRKGSDITAIQERSRERNQRIKQRSAELEDIESRRNR